MKLHPTIINNIMEEVQNLAELGGCESHSEYIFNLTFLELHIKERLRIARQNLEETLNMEENT